MSEVIAIKQSTTSNTGGGLKDLYEVGEIPPLGHVPEKMYAWAIRKERHGPPDEQPCRSRWCRPGSSTATTYWCS